MKRKQLARETAKATGTTDAAAEDLIDDIVAEILRKLKAGEVLEIAELERRWVRPKARPAGGK